MGHRACRNRHPLARKGAARVGYRVSPDGFDFGHEHAADQFWGSLHGLKTSQELSYTKYLT